MTGKYNLVLSKDSNKYTFNCNDKRVDVLYIAIDTMIAKLTKGKLLTLKSILFTKTIDGFSSGTITLTFNRYSNYKALISILNFIYPKRIKYEYSYENHNWHNDIIKSKC